MDLHEIKLVQAKSLEIFLYFKQFCEKHNLTYFLCGGACIGAIRHKGFIPWDDDIDMLMFRDDYEKLGSLWEQYADTDRYSYSRSNEKASQHRTDTAIQDNHTTFINYHSRNADINHGLAIEIIPLDGCPKSVVKQYKQIFFAMIYSLFSAQRLPDRQGRLLRTISKFLLRIIKSPRKRYKIWSYAEKQMIKYNIEDCDYIKELVCGFRSMKRKLPKELFKEVVYVEYEGHKVPVPIGYDTYLKMIFGDYMAYPPESERKPKHHTVYINLDEGYKNFKGKHYCTEIGN